MNAIKSIVVGVASVLFAGVVSAETPDVGEPSKTLKVLMIGNSYSVCVQKQMPQIAKAMGYGLDLASLYIGGCRLERHWKNIVASRKNPSKKQYRYTRFIDGVEQKERNANIQEALMADKWDVITLQQQSSSSADYATFQPYADNIVKVIKELAPQAEIVLQETWSYSPHANGFAEGCSTPLEMYHKVHLSYARMAEHSGFRVIPTGTAVQLYRARLPVKAGKSDVGNDVVGVGQLREKDGKIELPDSIHFNGKGHYLQGLVWTARLFGADVRTCEYKAADVSDDEAKVMKECAMAAINGEELPKAGEK